MAVTRKTTTTTDTSNIAFNKIPKSKLFADDLVPPPVAQPMQQMSTVTRTTTNSYNNEQVIDPTLLLLLSLFNNSNQAPAPYPYPMPQNTGGGTCPNYYPNLPSDISDIKAKLEELKNLVLRTPRTVETQTGEQVVYDDSGLYNLISQNHEDSWNKLLDIEAKLLELQNEHYDIYNSINSIADSSKNEYYEEYYEPIPQQQPVVVPQPVPQQSNNNDEYEEYEEVTTTMVPVEGEDEYYDEYTTTTTEQYGDDGYYEGDEYYDVKHIMTTIILTKRTIKNSCKL